MGIDTGRHSPVNSSAFVYVTHISSAFKTWYLSFSRTLHCRTHTWSTTAVTSFVICSVRSEWPHDLKHFCLRPLKHWDRGTEVEAWMSAFLLCWCCPVWVAALRQGWPPVRGILLTVYKIHNSRLILVGSRPEGLIRKIWDDNMPRHSPRIL
jgi:hypothetical protein